MADRLEIGQETLIEIGTARLPRLFEAGRHGRLRFDAAFIAIGIGDLEEVIDHVEGLFENLAVHFRLRPLG